MQTERARALLATNEGSSPERNDRDRAFRLAITARVLALSGETDRAREHITQALAIEPSEDRYIFRRILAYAESNLGQVEAAWLLIQPFADDGYDLSHGELLAFKAYYDQVYGESPSYRAYVAKIAAEKK